MRIAIQISGLLRYSDQSVKSLIENVITPLEADVFASFWDCEPRVLTNWQRQIGPKMIEVENWELIRPAFNQLNKYPIYSNLVPMMWKFYQVNKLKSAYELANNFAYDAVIQLRSDGLFFEKFPRDQLESAVEQKTILTTLRYSENIDLFISPRMADTLFCGPKESMDRVAGFIWALENQLKTNEEQNKNYYSQVPEILQSQIWNAHNISINKLTGSGPENNYHWDLDPGRK